MYTDCQGHMKPRQGHLWKFFTNNVKQSPNDKSFILRHRHFVFIDRRCWTSIEEVVIFRKATMPLVLDAVVFVDNWIIGAGHMGNIHRRRVHLYG